MQPGKLCHKQYITIVSKISNTISISDLKSLVFKAGIQKMLVRIDNREDPDQTAS